MAGKRRIVIALGGNAISRPDQEGNVGEQFANSRITAKALTDLVEQGCQLIVTHGNGPQIGNFLLRNEAAAGTIYELPMEVAIAHVQGGMGFMIAQTFTNELRQRGHDRIVAAMVTTVLVDRDDPAFDHPHKPIGRVMTKDEADRFDKFDDWQFKEVSPGAFRRVVPSPDPKAILEIGIIRDIVDRGELIVTCGGGGIPVILEPNEGYQAVRAVIDKDLASTLLAVELNADSIMFLTDVERVCVNFRKPDERQIEQMTLEEAQRLYDAGEFPAGSMGPKVLGAIRFLQGTDAEKAEVIIGPLHQAAAAVAGKTGTRITRS